LFDEKGGFAPCSCWWRRAGWVHRGMFNPACGGIIRNPHDHLGRVQTPGRARLLSFPLSITVIPAQAGMTRELAGMTGEVARMTVMVVGREVRLPKSYTAQVILRIPYESPGGRNAPVCSAGNRSLLSVAQLGPQVLQSYS
jgi:hypothetical protein